MGSAFTIRPATLDDAPTLAALGAQTFRETFEAICSSQDLADFLAEAYGDAIQRTELADPSRPALVLEAEGRPLGFAQLRLGHREPCVTGSRPVELQRIYVLREAHGSGFDARQGFREAGDHVFQIGQQIDRDLILVKDLS